MMEEETNSKLNGAAATGHLGVQPVPALGRAEVNA